MSKNRPLTFEEKKNHKYASRHEDRQNTLWAKEIVANCHHDWKPLNLDERPCLTNRRCYCVCMKCCSWSYVELGWVGYYTGSPDLLEEELINEEKEVDS